MYDYIMQRMTNMGYDPKDVVIEAKAIEVSASGYPTTTLLHESNNYYYLYDCQSYTNAWTIESDISHTTNSEFIVNSQVPMGIIEMTGNIKITVSAANTFLFYKVFTGKLINS